MSLQQEGEQIGGRDREFWNEQERLLDSSDKHIIKGCVAGATTGLAMATVALTAGPVGGLIAGGVIGLEVVHQLVAIGVDLRKHELNKRKHEKIEADLDKSLLP